MVSSELYIVSFFKSLNYFELFHALFVLGLGWILASIVSKVITRSFSQKISEGNLHLLKRLAYYSILFIFFISALRGLGFELEVILGAAGIFSVAIGFASQTSASNIVSGVFLMAERSFNVNDTLSINGITGKVLSIDWLSTKLRTQDNTFVRVPNELIIKSQFINLSKLPTRRVDIKFHLAQGNDLSYLREILFSIAKEEPLALLTPEPELQFLGIDKEGLQVQFSSWCQQEMFYPYQTRLLQKIHQQFIENNITFSAPLAVKITQPS